MLHISRPWDRTINIPWLTMLDDHCCYFCFWCHVTTKFNCQTARRRIISPWWCQIRFYVQRVPRNRLDHQGQSDARSRTVDRESSVNSCGHVVEACRVVSPAPGVSPSHLWPCDLHDLWRTPFDRPWDTHLADTRYHTSRARDRFATEIP